MSQLDSALAWPAGLTVVFGYGIWRLSKIGSRDPLLPPGPPTLPLLGNLTILPLKDTYIKFTEWSRKYDGLYSLKVGSQTIIVVSSVDAVHEILEKNGAITADRPSIEPVRRFTAPSGMVAFSPYGPQWRKMRKAAAELMKPSMRIQQRPIRMAEVSQLLFDIQEEPQDLFYQIQRASVSSLFSIVGGVRMPRANTPMFKKFFELWDILRVILEPGDAPPVDLFPILNYIPDMFVRNWKARCMTIHRMMQEILGELADGAARRLNQGQPNGCYLETLFQKAEDWELNHDDILGVTSGLVIAGIVSTSSLLQTIVFLAAAHPEAQRKVHEELDRVIGPDRAPTLDDIPNLPQLNAFIRETHRFRTNGPLGVPHLAQEDQFYKGQLIPKGSTIFLNSWATLHDPDLYDNPDSFDPDRFIRSPYGTKEGIDKIHNVEALKRLETVPFGAGRRRCVGISMANEAADLFSANLFWAFDFCHLLDDNGEPQVKPNLWAFTSGTTNDPLPFKCKIKTRSSKGPELIKQNYINSTNIFEQFERELSNEDRQYVEEVRAGLQD